MLVDLNSVPRLWAPSKISLLYSLCLLSLSLSRIHITIILLLSIILVLLRYAPMPSHFECSYNFTDRHSVDVFMLFYVFLYINGMRALYLSLLLIPFFSSLSLLTLQSVALDQPRPPLCSSCLSIAQAAHLTPFRSGYAFCLFFLPH